jgi:hypothetical protein
VEEVAAIRGLDPAKVTPFWSRKNG